MVMPVFRLQREGNHRQQFAGFLERLAITSLDKVDKEEWLSFVITHYPDEFLEEKRRCCVRLACGYLEHRIDSPEGKQLLSDWAHELRTFSSAP
jgi:hypothetical protein